MKFIRIVLITGIVYFLHLHLSNSSGVSMSNSHQTVNRETFIENGSMPNAFKLKIVFLDENYEHTYTLNNGGNLIVVEVAGKAAVLSTGELNQIYGAYDCSITSNALSLSGNIDIKRTTTIFGDKEVSAIKTTLRDNIIKIIINEIRNI